MTDRYRITGGLALAGWAVLQAAPVVADMQRLDDSECIAMEYVNSAVASAQLIIHVLQGLANKAPVPVAVAGIIDQLGLEAIH